MAVVFLLAESGFFALPRFNILLHFLRALLLTFLTLFLRFLFNFLSFYVSGGRPVAAAEAAERVGSSAPGGPPVPAALKPTGRLHVALYSGE